MDDSPDPFETGPMIAIRLGAFMLIVGVLFATTMIGRRLHQPPERISIGNVICVAGKC